MEDLFIKFISAGTLVLDLIIISFVLSILFKSSDFYKDIFKKHGLKIIFTLSLVSSLFSLVLSNVLNLPPCELCWFQRVFMYPIVLISAWSLIKKDYYSGIIYSRIMAIVGLIIAIYHVSLERLTILRTNDFICDPNTVGKIDCGNPYFVEFGFVTIPFMSLTLFILILIISYHANSDKR